MLPEPIAEGARDVHPPKLLQGAPRRAVPGRAGQDAAGSPGGGWMLVLLYGCDDPAGRGIVQAWAEVTLDVRPYTRVTVTGIELRVDLATGIVVRHRVDRWVPTRWRVVPWWSALAALGALAEDASHGR